MKKTKVTLTKGYHGSDGYMNPGQSFETTSDHAKQLAKDGFIEVEAEKEASKNTAKAKESKEAIETKEEKTEGESK